VHAHAADAEGLGNGAGTVLFIPHRLHARWRQRMGEARSAPSITAVNSIHIAAYVEELSHHLAAPTVKQHLAAIRMMIDWLATSGILPFNPATAVRGPKHV
jgi:site-specific recombinase XerC